MADNTCKKRRGKKDLAHATEMTRRRKAKRIAREAARQSACKAIRSLAGKKGPGLRDVSRRVRQARGAA